MKDGLGRVNSVLVLGGDSDIAIATARLLARRGAKDFMLAGRRAERLEARKAELLAAGATRVESGYFDAGDTSTHAAFFDDAFGRFERFDVVLVAFGVLGDQQAAEADPAVALEVVRTNSFGAASSLLHAAEHLRRQGQGTLVLLSTVAAQRPRRSNFIYGSSKSGPDALAEGLAFALREQGVQVLTVRPGFVKTKMTEGLKNAPFASTPEAVAKETVRAIASGKELVWAPGVMRYIMWAMRFVPTPLFRRLKF